MSRNEKNPVEEINNLLNQLQKAEEILAKGGNKIPACAAPAAAPNSLKKEVVELNKKPSQDKVKKIIKSLKDHEKNVINLQNKDIKNIKNSASKIIKDYDNLINRSNDLIKHSPKVKASLAKNKNTPSKDQMKNIIKNLDDQKKDVVKFINLNKNDLDKFTKNIDNLTKTIRDDVKVHYINKIKEL